MKLRELVTQAQAEIAKLPEGHPFVPQLIGTTRQATFTREELEALYQEAQVTSKRVEGTVGPEEVRDLPLSAEHTVECSLDKITFVPSPATNERPIGGLEPAFMTMLYNKQFGKHLFFTASPAYDKAFDALPRDGWYLRFTPEDFQVVGEWFGDRRQYAQGECTDLLAENEDIRIIEGLLNRKLARDKTPTGIAEPGTKILGSFRRVRDLKEDIATAVDQVMGAEQQQYRLGVDATDFFVQLFRRMQPYDAEGAYLQMFQEFDQGVLSLAQIGYDPSNLAASAQRVGEWYLDLMNSKIGTIVTPPRFIYEFENLATLPPGELRAVGLYSTEQGEGIHFQLDEGLVSLATHIKAPALLGLQEKVLDMIEANAK